LEFGTQAYAGTYATCQLGSNFPRSKENRQKRTYTLHFEREPESSIERDLLVGFEVIDGKICEVWTGEDRTTKFTDLVFAGKYGVWVDLLRERLTLTDALLERKLVLRGETNEIYGPTVWMSPGPLFGVSLTAATERIVDVARTIPTEFHGKYASESLKHQVRE
jgi:hypothetical protein